MGWLVEKKFSPILATLLCGVSGGIIGYFYPSREVYFTGWGMIGGEEFIFNARQIRATTGTATGMTLATLFMLYRMRDRAPSTD